MASWRKLSKLAAAFWLIALVIAGGYIWWYLPQRPTVLVGKAVIKSFQQPGTSFSLSTGVDGAVAPTMKGQIDKDGDSAIEFARQGQRFSLRTVGEASYIKGQDNQWLAVPVAASPNILSGSSLATASVDTSSLQAADRKRLERLYTKHSFLVVNTVYADQMIADSPSDHYQVVISKTQLRDFLRAAQQDIPKLNVSKSQIDSIINASFVGEPIDVWVDKRDKLVRQLAFSGNGSKTTVTFESYGQTADIAKPQGAKDLMTTLRP